MTRQARLIGGLIILLTASGWAQVGHPPDRSPYRDINRTQTLSGSAGIITGSRGLARVGPSSATTFGARYEIRLSGPTDALVSVTYVDADRFVVDPNQDVDARVSGPVGQSVLLADVGLLFILTGTKTWHKLAPYVGFSLGIATASSTAADSSGYGFGTRFSIQPALGIRYYVSQEWYVRLEGRDLLWQLRYPTTFFGPPPDNPDLPPVLDPDEHGETEWTHQLWLHIGVAFTFRL